MRKIIVSILLMSSVIVRSQGQFKFDSLAEIKTIENIFDKLKSKTSFKYDALSEILQVGLNKGILTGNTKEFSLKSSIYGLMVLGNKDYEIDKNYSKLTFQRNFEIGFNMKLNDDNRISGFGLAAKYAIINMRDLSIGKEYDVLFPKTAAIQKTLVNLINPVITAFYRDPAKKNDREKMNKFLHENSNIKDFPKFFNELKTYLSGTTDSVAIDQLEKMQTNLDELNKEYSAITKQIEKGPLLTFAGESSKTDSKWDFVKLKLEYTKGMGFVKDDENPWDLYLGAFYNIVRDSLSVSNNLNRVTGTLKGGINHVLVKDANNQSVVEILGGFEYNSVFQGKYVNENNNQLNALFNLSFRIAPNLYLPLEVKYDPDKSNFLGQVRLKWDMLRSTH